jgi:hypothetical protein
LHLAAQQVDQGQSRAAIRHVPHVDAGHRFEHFGRDVRDRSDPARSEIEFPGIGLCIGDQFRNAVHRDRRIDLEHVGHAEDAGNGSEVMQEIEFQIPVKRGIGRIGGRREQERVAVGRRFRDEFGADVAAGARFIVEHERLAEFFRKPLRKHASDHVGRAARRKSKHDVDGPVRIIERERWLCASRERCGRTGCLEKKAARKRHGVSLSGGAR